MGFYKKKVEWGPAKNFITPPFFDHKSATKRPPEHKKIEDNKSDFADNKSDTKNRVREKSSTK
jgi:hypothetical protein